MTVFGKLTMALFGLMIAALGGLAIYDLLDWPRESIDQIAVLVVLAPLAAILALSGIYIAWRGISSGKLYVSPTGTGETGPDR